MGQGVDFPGTNFTFLAPKGEEETCNDLRVFHNGSQIVTCWQLSDTELREIINSGGKVYLAIEGKGMPPVYVGSETNVRAMVADKGVWKK